MSFWKRLFENKKDKQKTKSHVDKYRIELEKSNIKTIADLENLVKPFIKNAIKFNVLPASRPPENSQLISHFGGQPYFENDELWPKSKKGNYLDFIFQVFNADGAQLPNNIELIQFYYDWDESPWDTKDDGWLVKIYKKVEKDNVLSINKPEKLGRSKFCKINFDTVKSLPDWEGIEIFSNHASKLSCILNEDEPWLSYQKTVTKLIGEQDYQSQLGGYPKWIQGEDTPLDNKGNKLQLLFQIDSEENAQIMWGDTGLIYVFHDEKSERVEFVLQCY